MKWVFGSMLFGGCGILGSSLHAVEISMPEIYSDHMVLQTDVPIQFSGRVAPIPEGMEMRLAGQAVPIEPSLFGSWAVTLDPVSEAGGVHAVEIWGNGERLHALENVTFGDVWICGGQSNMSWDMTTINNSAAEIAGAEFPDIRLMEVALRTSSTPRDDIEDFELSWSPCTPATVRQFSAVGYLFGRELHQTIDRPIGLIQSAWGGSRIETWIPKEALEENLYGEAVLKRSFATAQHRPMICYNAMIHGLEPLGVKGVIWYQGESNQGHAAEYRSLHETLITSWRSHWRQPELPFYLVQLANYAPGARWERIREAQTQTLAVPHTGMAVTIDIGASNDIHPRNKQGTATRLAALALAKTYGLERVYSGPQWRSVRRDGDAMVIEFDHVGSGLVGVDGGTTVLGFERLSAGGSWSRANAAIVGDTVVIAGSLFAPDPQGVRYGWASDPVVSLSNVEGFPALPFQFSAEEGIDYRSWSDRLVGPTAVRGPEEDADGDGESNLVRYATSGRGLLVDGSPEAGWGVSFHRRAGAMDVSVALEQSRDLEQWDEVWTPDEADGSGFQWSLEREWGESLTDRWSVTVPAEAGDSTYYRVRYTLEREEE